MKNAAIGIVLDKDQVLWVKRRDLPIWVLPGGGVDDEESPLDAACREVLEESGLNVELVREAACYSPINKLSSLTHVYIFRALKGTLGPQEESIDAQFYPIDSPPLPHFPLHQIWIEEALANPKKVISRPIDELTFLNVGCFFLKHPIIFLSYLFRRMRGF